MIVKMRKVFVVTRQRDAEALLDGLADLGAVHLAPVAPGSGLPDEPIAAALDRVGRAMQILGGVAAGGQGPDVSPKDAAAEAVAIHQRSAERNARLTALHRQIDQLEMWGETRVDQFELLREAGVNVAFYAVAPEALSAFDADVVQALGETSAGRLLVALAWRKGEPTVPDEAEELPLPERDRPAIRAEAAEIDRQLRQDHQRLCDLAALLPALTDEHRRLENQSLRSAAMNGAMGAEALFAVQGWVPAETAELVPGSLAGAVVDAAVEFVQPAPDEQPPTLIRYPRWARPVQALFNILGTVPGYEEYDLSPFFMIALPVFAAMLFGDGGYGLVFTIVAVALRGRLVSAGKRPAANLLLVFALTTLGWGVLTGNYFGVTLTDMQAAGGIWAPLGSGLAALAPLYRADPAASRQLVMKISFLFGTTHLVAAHLRQAIGLAPNVRFLAEIGWVSFLTGMLGVVWMLFFPRDIWMRPPWIGGLLCGGAVAVVLFSHPSRNPLKAIGMGVLANLLPALGAFSDTISYIRLMAVGLASYYIASAFNGLGMRIAGAGIPAAVGGAAVIVLAHLLNIALGTIAVFAHGVRLNMLEFSSNAGVQWTGYAYAPFVAQRPTQGES